MKHSVFTAFAGALVLILAGCGAAPQATPGTVSGIINGGAGQTVYLKTANLQGFQEIASAQVAEDGHFQLTPASGLVKDYYFVTLEKDNFISVITDSTEAINLTLNAESLRDNPQAQGSKDTEALYALLATLKPNMDLVQTLMAEAKDPQKTAEERSAAKQEAKKAQTELQKACGNFIRENADSPVALEALSGLSMQRSMKSYEIVLTKLKESMGHSNRYQLVNKQVETVRKQMATQQAPGNMPKVGDMAPDIQMAGLDGKQMKLSDLRGKVVLIDFWASWCGPCRRENPNVVRAYAEYKDKGFEVFSVSLDKQQDRWEAAIAQDGLVWPSHVSDLQGWNNAAAKLYDVHSIPATFLIDQEGKVVASKLRGDVLDQKLEELLGA